MADCFVDGCDNPYMETRQANYSSYCSLGNKTKQVTVGYRALLRKYIIVKEWLIMGLGILFWIFGMGIILLPIQLFAYFLNFIEFLLLLPFGFLS